MRGRLPALLIALLSLALSAAAQPADTLGRDSLRLADVVITEARVPTRFDERARSVEVITAADLQRLPVQSLQDVLDLLTGVDVRQRGPLGIQANVSIRGGTFNQVAVLVDGVLVSDPQTGHFILNVPVMPQDIARIEVLKGPGAKVFGQGAFAGAIHIITKRAAERSLHVSAMGGQHGLYEGGASLSLPNGRLQQRLSAYQRGSSGFSDNTDFSLTNALYQAWLPLRRTELQLTAGYLFRRFGAMRYYQSSPPRQFETNEGLLVSLAAVGQGRWHLTPRLTWRRHWDDYRLIRERPDTLRNRHRSDVLGLHLGAHRSWALGTTALGADLRLEAVTSTNLGDHRRTSAGLFVEHRLRLWNRLDVTPGVYVNAFTGQPLRAYPGLDLSLALTEGLRAFGSVGRAFRMPTYTELYLNRDQPSPAVLGNAALSAEDSWSYETGLRGRWGAWAAELTGFIRQGRSLIDFSRLVGQTSGPSVFRNVQDVRTVGYEASVAYTQAPLGLGLSRARVGFTYLTQDGQSPEFVSRYVFNYLRGQLVAEGAVQLWRQGERRLELSLVGRYEQRANQPTPYWLLDARLALSLPRWSLYLEGTNLTDTAYADFIYADGSRIELPRRWLRAGLTFSVL